jgi:hypothetical protein
VTLYTWCRKYILLYTLASITTDPFSIFISVPKAMPGNCTIPVKYMQSCKMGELDLQSAVCDGDVGFSSHLSHLYHVEN